MGRKSREKKERREGGFVTKDQKREARIEEIEQELTRLADGDHESWIAPDYPLADRHAYMEDVLAFESVGSGPSLFEGLEAHGVSLPRPEDLDEDESLDKLREVVLALIDQGVFLIGFEHLSPRDFYSTLWNETLWEGCWVKRRNRKAITFMDVSHQLPRSEVMRYMADFQRLSRVQ
ncbi:MAG: hypothetical protein EHM61_04730 [Acidobacteria bacterium]|nr:MAG: hypothetical protein EHM61_04730 [Acidobacteriota bacterium]